jgi:hypothetical protein
MDIPKLIAEFFDDLNTVTGVKVTIIQTDHESILTTIASDFKPKPKQTHLSQRTDQLPPLFL